MVSHAKLLAKQQRKSLSAMIEQLLAPTDSGQLDTTASIPTALRLRGIAKGALSPKTDKQIREMMYKDRYGL
ncbi:hypothetical protein GCM10028817_32460 [Spirosoma pomorum]